MVNASDRPGVAPPGAFDPGAEMPMVQRCFAFLDLCRFTAFSEKVGEVAAGAELGRFRLLCRAVTSHRGVRISKWLGDGVMLVGVESAPVLACAVELVGRYDALDLHLRGGVATGGALMIDGDDYVGRPVNLAARLCAGAGRGEVMVCRDGLEEVPSWVELSPARARRFRGLGRVDGLARASMSDGIDLGPAVGIAAVSDGIAAVLKTATGGS